MSFCGETRPFHLAQAPDTTDHTCSKDVEILFHDNHRAVSLLRGTGQRPGAAAASHADPLRLRGSGDSVWAAPCADSTRGGAGLAPATPGCGGRARRQVTVATPGCEEGRVYITRFAGNYASSKSESELRGPASPLPGAGSRAGGDAGT